jgi:two-component system, NtrC family, sensor kinase
MKLARKLILALVLGVIAVMAGHAWYLVRKEVMLYETDVKPKTPRGRAFLLAVQQVWRTDGEQAVTDLVEAVGAMLTDIETRWVRTDVAPGHPQYPHHPAAVTASQTGEIATCIVTDAEGRTKRYAYLPVQQGHPLVLEASESLENEMAYVATTHRSMVVTTVVIVLVCALIIAFVGMRLVGRPMKELLAQARRMGDGDYSVRLPVRQHDEIGELAAEMNALCDRLIEANRRVTEEIDAKLAAFEQLRHADRLATIGQLAAGVAHELGTPLSVVEGRTQLVAADPAASDDVRTHARIVLEQAARMERIIRQLLDFARRRRAQPVLADLRHVVGRMLELLSAVGSRRTVRFELEASQEPAMAAVDEGQLQQALTNIVLNGAQAMPQGGRIRVRIASVRVTPPPALERPEGEYRRIDVEDEGAGIAPEHLPHIFEPFFTTKGIGEGTGLGLSVAHGIIGDHGGWIDVESAPGRGTIFHIYLPAAAKGVAPLKVAS